MALFSHFVDIEIFFTKSYWVYTQLFHVKQNDVQNQILIYKYYGVTLLRICKNGGGNEGLPYP